MAAQVNCARPQLVNKSCYELWLLKIVLGKANRQSLTTTGYVLNQGYKTGVNTIQPAQLLVIGGFNVSRYDLPNSQVVRVRLLFMGNENAVSQ